MFRQGTMAGMIDCGGASGREVDVAVLELRRPSSSHCDCQANRRNDAATAAFSPRPATPDGCTKIKPAPHRHPVRAPFMFLWCYGNVVVSCIVAFVFQELQKSRNLTIHCCLQRC